MKFFFYKLIQIPSKGERMDNRFGTTSGMVIQTVMEVEMDEELGRERI